MLRLRQIFIFRDVCIYPGTVVSTLREARQLNFLVQQLATQMNWRVIDHVTT